MKTYIAGLALAAASLWAQEGPHTAIVEDHLVIHGATAAGGGVFRAGGGAVEFLSHEMSFDAKVVKGAPYSAEAVTEITQVLADGNRIHRQTSARVWRDGEGRTRREQVLAGIGPLVAGADAPRTVFINDSVAGVHYVLEPNTRTARKTQALAAGEKLRELSHALERMKGVPGGGGAAGEAGVFAMRVAPPPGGEKANRFFKTQPLGQQVVEGVVAEGSRTVMTIAAGEIGNERPIEIVSERWYSPELQTVVMTRHSDPRTGETVYRLTNINRAEPDQGLFEVPAGYSVSAEPILLQKMTTSREKE